MLNRRKREINWPSRPRATGFIIRNGAGEILPGDGGVEIDSNRTICPASAVYSLGNDIPRREFAQRMGCLHERHPVDGPQNSSFAAHRLRDQKTAAVFIRLRQSRRVELDEFEVARFGTGPDGRSQSIARRGTGVRRMQEH
jgi:hypothetical protein